MWVFLFVLLFLPHSGVTKTYKCPKGTVALGGRPPNGFEQWCESVQKKGGRPQKYYRNGPIVLWHKNGVKKAEGYMKDGFAWGKWTEWYESGHLMMKGTVYKTEKTHRRDGLWSVYYPNGLLWAEGRYAYEKNFKKKRGFWKTGLWTWWDDKRKKTECRFEKGFPAGNKSFCDHNFAFDQWAMVKWGDHEKKPTPRKQVLNDHDITGDGQINEVHLSLERKRARIQIFPCRKGDKGAKCNRTTFHPLEFKVARLRNRRRKKNEFCDDNITVSYERARVPLNLEGCTEQSTSPKCRHFLRLDKHLKLLGEERGLKGLRLKDSQCEAIHVYWDPFEGNYRRWQRPEAY